MSHLLKGNKVCYYCVSFFSKMYDFAMMENKKGLKWVAGGKSAEKKTENIVFDDFYNENKILIVFMKLLGVMPISKNRDGRLECRLTSPASMYSVLEFIIISIGAGFCLNMHLRVLNKYDITFDDKITMYAAVVYMGFHLLPLIAFCEGRKTAKLFTSVRDFEVKYYKITKQTLLFKMRHYQYIFLLVVCFLTAFFTWFASTVIYYEKERYNYDSTDTELTIMLIIYIHYLWVVHAVVANWIFLMLGIRKAARILLKDIEDTRLRSFAFEDLYGLWLDLKNITEDSGMAFSWMYIYFLSYMFLLVMGSSYSLLASIANPVANSNYNYLGISIICGCTFAVVGDCAHRTAVELRDDFNNSLLKLLSNERDPVLRREMKWFIQTMSLNPPIITLSGYITLNRGFNVSMLGTLVTYIVVVLQFRQQTPYLTTTTASSVATTPS